MIVEMISRGALPVSRCMIRCLFLLSIFPGLVTTGALAQGVEQEDVIEEIITIGSRSTKERTAVDSPVPVDIFNEEVLKASGQTETSRMLQFVAPSFNFSTSTISDGTDLVRPATLRGMQPDQTLVLVNGKRRHTSALMHVNGSIGRGATGVDLNAIPPSSIERIEVLRDGAAAQYGSDAIAGVINVVLKDQTETIDPYLQWGSTYNGDGDQAVASVNAGFPFFNEGFINLTAEYRDRDATDHSGRDPRQIFNFEEQVFGDPQLGATDCPANLNSECTLPPEEATFDRRNHRYGDPDSENWYFSWNAGMPVFGDSELYTFGGYADREGESGGFYRREYDDRDLPAVSPGGFLPLINTDVTDTSAGLGLRGEVFGWGYDASVVYGENEFEFEITNSLNVSLGEALTPTSANAGTLTTDQIVLNLDFVNSFDMLGFEDVSTAFGFEWREDGYEIEAGEFASYANGPDDDPATAPTNQYGGLSASGIQVFPGFRPGNALDVDRDAWAIYGDIEADITDRWLLSFAVRYEDYDDFGDTLNGKLAARWNVVDTVALRAAISTGFRAPSLNQQFFNNISTQFVTVAGVANVPTEVATLRNDSDTVRDGFGVPELDEETSLNLSTGFTWQPTDAFSMTADVYYIEVDDRVVLSGRFTPETIGNDMLACDGNPDPALSNCPIAAILDPLAAQFGVTNIRAQFFSNAIDTETSGIDLIMEYGFEYAGGLFNLSGAFNWNNVSVEEVRIPSTLIDSPGAENTLYSRQEIIWTESGQPDEHWVLTGTYDRGPMSVLLRGNWFGEVKSTEDDALACEATQTCRDQTFAGKWLVDVRTSWAFTDNLRVNVGVDNIFDAQPDKQTAATNNSGIFPYSRRTTPFGFNGGFYYASLNYSFGHGLD